MGGKSLGCRATRNKLSLRGPRNGLFSQYFLYFEHIQTGIPMFRSLILPAVVLALLLSACSQEGPERRSFEPRAVPVVTETLRFERARTRIEAVGTARAKLSAEIFPATSGEVVSVNFEPGQFVSKGDVLVELDAREASLAVRLAKIRLEDATRLYERYSRSANSGAVLPTTLDAARTAMEAARINLESAEIDLDYQTIEAVFDGHVGATEVDPGDRIGPNTLVTTLDDRSSLLMSFDIPEAFVGELAPGEMVSLETWSRSGSAIDGEIVDIGSRIDPQNRTFEARARVENTDDRLRPGMSFRVAIDVTGERFAVVSEIALQWGAEGAFVWSIVDGAAVRVPVEVIQRREGRVLVDGELPENASVVVEGTQSMREGVPVKLQAERLAYVR